MRKQQQANLAMHYTAYFPDTTSLEWFEATHKDMLIQQFRNGKLHVAGHTKNFGSTCARNVDMELMRWTSLACSGPHRRCQPTKSWSHPHFLR